MAIRSATVTAGLLTLVFDDGRTFTLTKSQMVTRLAADAGSLAVAAPRVITAIQTLAGSANFGPRAFKLDVDAAGNIRGFSVSTNPTEVFA